MRNTIFTGLMLIIISVSSTGQGKYLTNDGIISFYSHTTIKDIKAVNNKVSSVVDATTGEVAVIVKMTDFKFEKKLMQEHFNENFVESEKYPKATFIGTITNNAEVDYTKSGTYSLYVTGDMTIHGITHSISTEGSVEVTGTGIIARTQFQLNPADYNIKIPKVVRKNIATIMEINTEFPFKPI